MRQSLPPRNDESMTGRPGLAAEIRERLVLHPGGDDLVALYPWFEAIAERIGLPGRVAFRIQLVLEEAASNAARHSYEPGAAGEVALDITATPARVVAVLRDDGRPFDPLAHQSSAAAPETLADAAIGGLGVKLIRTYCADLRYRWDEGINELTMGFDVMAMSEAPGAAGR
jgi:anti-sigma regulatory factor (Ser/Thr protein kinase)